MTVEPIKPLVYRRSQGQLHSSLRPIVLELGSRKKERASGEGGGGEKYSKELKEFERAEANLVRIVRRATRAFAHGIDTYDQERRRSAESKIDGAIEDFPHNSAKAISEALKEASDIPVDVVDALAPKDYRKRMRQDLRRVSKSLRVFRL